jgi:glycyl-tRNA synthetase beta chain
MTQKDALLEIGSEELPASFIAPALRQLKELAGKSLSEQQISFGTVEAYGTPRRLALVITHLAPVSEERRMVVQGPPVDRAKGADGQWTPAALGFARKQGVDPSELTAEDGRLCVVHHIKGRTARALLQELFPQWISRLEFPKSMVWETTQVRYARPVRWIAAMYGPDLVSFSLAGVRSGRFSYGLYLQSAKKVPIASAGKYVALLKNQCVLVDPAVRREAIIRLCEQAVRRSHGRAIMPEELLDQVVNLVEHPVAIMGDFDKSYLDLPREILTTCLEHHQKFFPVEKTEGKTLLPHFIGIRNGMSVHQDTVREGYERVLSARLADARFFFEHDCRTKLADKTDLLKGVMLQGSLGSLFDKKERTKKILEALAEKINNPVWMSGAMRAADLCKADLVTAVVREFPELQGVMARIYALHDGEDPAISQALEEHYWPVTVAGNLPASDLGSALALADKIDTLVGDFAVGLVPSGSADPYGLRRVAAGILRILEDRRWPLVVEELVAAAWDALPENVRSARPAARDEVLQFLKQRLAVLLEERNYRFDEVEAILVGGIGRLPDSIARLDALHGIRSREEFGALSAAFKRAMNIVRQAQQKGILERAGDGAQIQAEHLKENAEQVLFRSLNDIDGHITRLIEAGTYAAALESMVPLREPLDQFFDGVMVMADDSVLRANRLALLTRVVNLFLRIADFSKLQNA